MRGSCEMNKEMTEFAGLLLGIFILLCAFAVAVGTIAIGVRWALAG